MNTILVTMNMDRDYTPEKGVGLVTVSCRQLVRRLNGKIPLRDFETCFDKTHMCWDEIDIGKSWK